jgi:uncharacterized membrane protein
VDRSRLEAFSDGVFAVAITLLAFNIAVRGPGHGPLARQLAHLWPSFLAYLVSFFVIGIIWVNHHAVVQGIRVVDRTLLFLNLVLLMFVVLIPFATTVVADYRLSRSWDSRVSVAVYAGVFFGMSVGFGAVFEWILHGERMHNPLPSHMHWPARIRFISGALVYVLTIGVALINAVAGFALIGVVAVYYIFERTPSANGDPANGDPANGDTVDGTGIASPLFRYLTTLSYHCHRPALRPWRLPQSR